MASRLVRFPIVTLAAVAAAGPRGALVEKDPRQYGGVPHGPPVFRVGSGASGYELPTPAPAAVPEPRPLLERLRTLGLPTAALSFIFLSLFVMMMMMPNGGTQHTMHQRDFNYRVPPYWSPEIESSYSFRAYMTDIALWVMLTDLQPCQQCAAIIIRLPWWRSPRDGPDAYAT